MEGENADLIYCMTTLTVWAKSTINQEGMDTQAHTHTQTCQLYDWPGLGAKSVKSYSQLIPHINQSIFRRKTKNINTNNSLDSITKSKLKKKRHGQK